jgi:hypothetical protein
MVRAMTDRAGLLARGTVALVLLVTVASGPILGSVSFTEQRVTAMDVAPGNATVGEIDFPTNVTLAADGDGRYRYSGTPIRVTFERITGGDVQLTYGLLVPALNVSQSVTQIVSGPTADETVTVEYYSYVRGERVTPGRYEATAYVSLVEEGENELVARETVSVEVSNATR